MLDAVSKFLYMVFLIITEPAVLIEMLEWPFIATSLAVLIFGALSTLVA